MRKALWYLLVGIAVGMVLIAWTSIPDCYTWSVSC
jgi:hypothetical protein